MGNQVYGPPSPLGGAGAETSHHSLTQHVTAGGVRVISDADTPARRSERRNAYGWLLAPAAVSALLLAGSLISEAPLERLDTAATIGNNVHLVLSPMYLALDPICRFLDALLLLTLTQLASLFGTTICASAVYGALTCSGHSATRRWQRAAIWAATATAAILAICAADLLLPRPMAALAVQSQDVVTIDFHSHTSASHDGRPGFGPEANRAWHSAGGFNVAYLSDHANWKAIDAAQKHNPAIAGDGTMLLSAVELHLGRYYVIAMGPEANYQAAVIKGSLNDDALPADVRSDGLIYTLPLPQQVLQGTGIPGLKDLSGIEICDAGPRGLAQSREYRETLIAWADKLNVPVVASSNNHGWGRTVACWTLMEIPGWRQMDQAHLSSAIQQHLREGRKATSVVAMRSPAGESTGWGSLATAPMLVIYLTRSLSTAERFSWLAYVWGVALLRRRWRQCRVPVRLQLRQQATRAGIVGPAEEQLKFAPK